MLEHAWTSLGTLSNSKSLTRGLRILNRILSTQKRTVNKSKTETHQITRRIPAELSDDSSRFLRLAHDDMRKAVIPGILAVQPDRQITRQIAADLQILTLPKSTQPSVGLWGRQSRYSECLGPRQRGVTARRLFSPAELTTQGRPPGLAPANRNASSPNGGYQNHARSPRESPVRGHGAGHLCPVRSHCRPE